MGSFFQALRRSTQAGSATEPPRQQALAPAAAPSASAPVRQLPLDLATVPTLVTAATQNVWRTPTRALAREQFRMLRTRVLQNMRSKSQRTLLVTSTVPSEGKTLTSTNLALALSQLHEYRVCLVDTDLRRPGIAPLLHMSDPGPGLAACLRGDCRWTEAIWQVNDHLTVLPSKPVPDRAAELITGRSLRRLLDELLLVNDLVIMDGPPVAVTAEGQILAGLSDAALMVVRSGSAAYEPLCDTGQMLGSKLVGVVLNSARNIPRGAYFYKYLASDVPAPSETNSSKKSPESLGTGV